MGAPIAGRRHVELEGLIGFFANTLVLRTDLSGTPSVRDLLHRVRHVVLEADAHQDVPFEKLVEELAPARSLSHSPLFQVMFAFRSMTGETVRVGDLEIASMTSETLTAKFDMTLEIVEHADHLSGAIEYNTDLFDAATVARMAGHLRTVLEGIVADPAAPLSRVPLMEAAERQRVLVDWNATARTYAAGTLHGLVEAQVARTPAAAAVIVGEETISYAALDRQANRIAQTLRRVGVGPETRVGVCLDAERRAGGGAAGRAEGRRGVCAARSGVSGRAARVHGPRQRGAGGGDDGGADGAAGRRGRRSSASRRWRRKGRRPSRCRVAWSPGTWRM